MESQKYCAGANNQVVTICPQGYAKTNDGQCVPEEIPAVRVVNDNELSKQETTVVWNRILIGISVALFIVCCIALARCKKK